MLNDIDLMIRSVIQNGSTQYTMIMEPQAQTDLYKDKPNEPRPGSYDGLQESVYWKRIDIQDCSMEAR